METINPCLPSSTRSDVIFSQLPKVNSEPVPKKLDRLACTRDGIHNLENQREMLVNAALSEIRPVLDSIDGAIAELLLAASAIEGEIKEAVLTCGTTVRGNSLQAVFCRGKITYDSKGLDALGVVMPQILKFRKEGVPSVSIREVKH